MLDQTPNEPLHYRCHGATAKISVEPACLCDGIPLVKNSNDGEHLICSICGRLWRTVKLTMNGMTTGS